MRETYLVNWLGGTSGAFLTSLLHQIVTKPLTEEEIIFSENGNSHKVADKREYNIRINPKWEVQKNATDVPVYLKQCHRNQSKPLVMVDHNIPIYEDLFNRFPECKNIVVTRSKDMLFRLRGNMFFKNTCEGFPGNKEFWEGIRILHESIADYEDPRDVPIEKAEIFIKELCRQWPEHNHMFYNDDYPVPEEYKNNVLRIRFYDLIHNSNLVLNQLSALTNKPILPGVEQFYAKYLEAQDTLVKTKMPWLDDK